MPLGGFCPLPLRLGEGYRASEHNRRAFDTVALIRTAPLAVVRFTVASPTVTISWYKGMNGTGLADAPTATSASTGLATFTWASHYEDELLRSGRWKGTLPRASAEYSTKQLFATAWMDSNSTLVCSVQIYDISSGPPAVSEGGSGTLVLW